MYAVKTIGWSGKPYTEKLDDGIIAYHPGTEYGWKEIKRFKNMAEADDWLCNYCRETGNLITDFNIVRE